MPELSLDELKAKDDALDDKFERIRKDFDKDYLLLEVDIQKNEDARGFNIVFASKNGKEVRSVNVKYGPGVSANDFERSFYDVTRFLNSDRGLVRNFQKKMELVCGDIDEIHEDINDFLNELGEDETKIDKNKISNTIFLKLYPFIKEYNQSLFSYKKSTKLEALVNQIIGAISVALKNDNFSNAKKKINDKFDELKELCAEERLRYENNQTYIDNIEAWSKRKYVLWKEFSKDGEVSSVKKDEEEINPREYNQKQLPTVLSKIVAKEDVTINNALREEEISEKLECKEMNGLKSDENALKSFSGKLKKELNGILDGVTIEKDTVFGLETKKNYIGVVKGKLNSGTIKACIFRGEEINDSHWEYGSFQRGTANGVTWDNGEVVNGNFIDSTWNGGEFKYGTFVGSAPEKSIWKNGEFSGELIKNAVIRGGKFTKCRVVNCVVDSQKDGDVTFEGCYITNLKDTNKNKTNFNSCVFAGDKTEIENAVLDSVSKKKSLKRTNGDFGIGMFSKDDLSSKIKVASGNVNESLLNLDELFGNLPSGGNLKDTDTLYRAYAAWIRVVFNNTVNEERCKNMVNLASEEYLKLFRNRFEEINNLQEDTRKSMEEFQKSIEKAKKQKIKNRYTLQRKNERTKTFSKHVDVFLQRINELQEILGNTTYAINSNFLKEVASNYLKSVIKNIVKKKIENLKKENPGSSEIERFNGVLENLEVSSKEDDFKKTLEQFSEADFTRFNDEDYELIDEFDDLARSFNSFNEQFFDWFDIIKDADKINWKDKNSRGRNYFVKLNNILRVCVDNDSNIKESLKKASDVYKNIKTKSKKSATNTDKEERGKSFQLSVSDKFKEAISRVLLGEADEKGVITNPSKFVGDDVKKQSEMRKFVLNVISVFEDFESQMIQGTQVGKQKNNSAAKSFVDTVGKLISLGESIHNKQYQMYMKIHYVALSCCENLREYADVINRIKNKLGPEKEKPIPNDNESGLKEKINEFFNSNPKAKQQIKAIAVKMREVLGEQANGVAKNEGGEDITTKDVEEFFELSNLIYNRKE